MKIAPPELIVRIADEIRNGTADRTITKAEFNMAFGFEKLSKDREKKVGKLLLSLGITTAAKLREPGDVTFVIAHAKEKKSPSAHTTHKEGTIGSLITMHSKPVCIIGSEPLEALFARLIISWKSYARSLEDARGKARKITPSMAKDAVVKIVEVQADDLITEHYPADNTVFVMKDAENNITGCSSTREIDKELSRGHLWPYYLLKTIETLLRERITKSRLTHGEIQEAIQGKEPQIYEKSSSRSSRKKTFSEMT